MEHLHELLFQALETEIGGIEVYSTAIECAVNKDLKKEWEKYLNQTEEHKQILIDVLRKMELDPDTVTPGREVVKHHGESLVAAMKMTLNGDNKKAAELVAAECVVLAETKDHLNWQLIGACAKNRDGEYSKILKVAHVAVEDEEDEHLYHTKGWTRELWMDFLGLLAVIPPPEEKEKIKTAIGAARIDSDRA